MWTPGKSALLSLICTKIMILLMIGFIFTAPSLVDRYVVYTMKDSGIVTSLLVTLYFCAAFGLLALLCLDRLLSNIKKNQVFIKGNVKYLRILSWCCFAVSIILFFSGFYYLLFLMIAVAAGFFGLILRVVKNVIEQAVVIKNENDYTI